MSYWFYCFLSYNVWVFSLPWPKCSEKWQRQRQRQSQRSYLCTHNSQQCWMQSTGWQKKAVLVLSGVVLFRVVKLAALLSFVQVLLHLSQNIIIITVCLSLSIHPASQPALCLFQSKYRVPWRQRRADRGHYILQKYSLWTNDAPRAQ